jgi:PPE-repeat protein
MIDFAALPPEINSARMYAGAGSAPLLAAGGAWGNLATDLAETATAIHSQVTALAAVWIGPSASAMTASATTYTSWLTSAAAAAAETATQATAAASAYETAFAATVPPALIAANRATLMLQIATNFLGINTAAIMATEALYAEMWAQDVAAMSAYQASSAAATSALPQFTAAPQTTNPSAAVSNPLLQFIQTLIPGFTPGQPLQNLALALTSPLSTSFLSSAPYETPLQLLSLFTVLWGINSPSSPLAQAITNRITNTPIEIPPMTTPVTPPETTRAAIKAGIGDGERVGGKLSVPPSWARESTRGVPPESPKGVPLERPESSGLAGIGGLGGLGGLAGMRGTPTRQQHAPQYGVKPTIMPRHPFGG